MTAPRIISLVFVLFLAVVGELCAQDTLVVPGARVRVYSPDRVTGTIESLSPDALVLKPEDRDSSQAIPFASMTKLEVSQGLTSRTSKGAGIGFFVGGAAGLATAAIVCAIAGDCVADDPYTGLVYAFFGVLGAGVGTLTGAIIGSSSKTDRWETVSLDQIRVSLRPSDHLAVAVSVRIAF